MFGLIQSSPDSRDWNYAALKAPVNLPIAFQYDDTPLRDQGAHGTCVGFGSANLKDIHESTDSGLQASPLYIYRNAKVIDGLPAGTEGTTLRAALTVLKDKGVCSESDYPYSLIDKAPVEPAVTLGVIAKGKIAGYARCYTVEDIKQALVQSGPVLIGIGVSTAIRDLGVGIHHVTTLFGQIVGGHCLTITGYDDARVSGGKRGFFRVKNSWSSWGENGYFWMAYACVNERTVDTGFSFFMEAWSTLDLLTGFTGRTIELWVNQDIAMVDGKAISLDAPAVIMNSRTMVPLRFVAEALGLITKWDGFSRKVTLLKP